MPKYTLKILIDLESKDDLAARQQAVGIVERTQAHLEGVREIVLHSVADRKSIKLNRDGTFVGQWNRGG